MVTEKFYLGDSHKKNSEMCHEHLKQQKPVSKEEAIAQYQKLKQKCQNPCPQPSNQVNGSRK